MPITFDIDASAGIVIMTMTGTITRDDILGFVAGLAADPRFRETMGRLVISTETTGYPPPAEVAELVERMRQRNAANPPRFAVVATSPLGIGMANMFMGQSGLGNRTEIFPDEESARTWLLLANEASA